jgi:glycosyltransferase involved in cell wall biosynthesis
MSIDITIIIPTYNRCETLKKTLCYIERVETKSLNIEYLIVDNGSNDQTEKVIIEFSDRIPIRYLFEKRPGKNHALNRALNEKVLGDIVVFTDDDVTPNQDWVIAINDICQRWPNHSVFGGKIYVVWPVKDIPEWAKDPYIMQFGYSNHNYSDTEVPYLKLTDVPFGPNYWVRRGVFDNGLRFNEEIGPHPDKFTLGDESEFLIQLKNLGYDIIYSPKAVVGHRIQKKMISQKGILKRAYYHGKSSPYLFGPRRKELLINNPYLWYSIQCAVVIKSFISLYLSLMKKNRNKMLIKSVSNIYNISGNLEALRLFKNHLSKKQKT